MADTRLATLDTVIRQIRDDLRTMPHLRDLPDGVPDALNDYPICIVYPSSGAWRLGSHSGDLGRPMRWGQHTIRVELHVARKDLWRDTERIMWFCDTLPDYLFSGFKRDTYGGSVVTLGDTRQATSSAYPMRYQVLEMGWGGAQTLGWRWEIDVTIEAEIGI